MPDEKDDDMLQDPLMDDEDIILAPKKNPLDPDSDELEDEVDEDDETFDPDME